MKKLILIALALTLAACSGYQAVPPTSQPTAIPPTPVIQVQTVVVMITPTPLPPTPIPTVTPVPTEAPTLAPATDVPTQAAASGPTLSVPTQSTGVVNIPTLFNGPVFTNMTVSTNWFSLRCNPKAITFDLYSTDVYITQVEFYYRIRDKHSAEIPDAYVRGGSLETDGGNHFWLTYTGEQVNPDNRKYDGWFDFQFVGVNKLGQVVGRTERIESIVSYAIDCP